MCIEVIVCNVSVVFWDTMYIQTNGQTDQQKHNIVRLEQLGFIDGEDIDWEKQKICIKYLEFIST